MSYLDRVLLHQRVCGVGLIAVGVAGFTLMCLLIDHLMRASTGLLLLLYSAGALAIAGALLLVWRLNKPLRRRLRSTGGALCPGCGYDLAQTDTGICPECAEAWTPASARAAWQGAVGGWWPEAFEPEGP